MFDFWFSVRKLVSTLLYPPNLFLLLALLGIGFAWSRKWRKAGLALSTISLVVLFLLSLQLIVQPLLQRLENRYPPLPAESIPEPPPEWIFVLGSGSRTKQNAHDPSTAGLHAISQTRAIEGIRLARILPESTLVFMGAALDEDFSGAQAMADLAREMGIEPERILVVARPTSTWEEAKEAYDLAGTEPAILVTSALHLHRAVLLFERAGLTVLPAPTDFLSDENLRLNRNFTMSPQSWVAWQRIFHEWYGRIWANLY